LGVGAPAASAQASAADGNILSVVTNILSWLFGMLGAAALLREESFVHAVLVASDSSCQAHGVRPRASRSRGNSPLCGQVFKNKPSSPHSHKNV